MVNAENELFYVGMSRCLRRRLQTYFSSRATRRKECRTGRAARMVVWQPLAHPLIAVLRETELIRRFLPTRNVQGHPHRTRPGYLVLADHAAGWFHTSYTIPKRHAGVWGPMPINRRTREAANVLNQVFRLRDCPPATRMQFRGDEVLFDTDTATACLRAEMGTCLAPCVAACSRRQYARAVGDAKRFLNGTSNRILEQLREQMQEASSNCLFEKAARLRDALTILERIDVQLRRFHDWVDSATFAYPLRETRSARDVPWMIVVRGRIQILSTIASSRREVRRFGCGRIAIRMWQLFLLSRAGLPDCSPLTRGTTSPAERNVCSRNDRLLRLVFAFAAVVSLATSETASSQDTQEGESQDSHSHRAAEPIDVEEPLRGFLFVEGRYLHDVRRFSVLDGKLAINGETTPIRVEVVETLGRFFADEEEAGTDLTDDPPWWTNPLSVLVALLQQGESVVLWADAPPVLLLRTDGARDLLETLTHEKLRDEAKRTEELQFLRSREASNRFDIAASHRLEGWIGSLTTVLVLIVVMASGQVLLHPPQQESRFFDVDRTSATWWIQLRTTMLIAGFTVCDALMMALAYQAGRLRDFNPLTSKLLEYPTPVVLARLILSLLCIVPLLAMWQYAGVRKIAWWICLTLAVFAVRELAMLSTIV
ncbi:UvrABC system protein C (Protein UvrC) (Excinuclease ABC subunit C) [Durusdinium trenchii]|uniref:UvrABC system protein C (Protein UvrC) (Excinuclease ABC subunit C) n=1 Tax=Durusdinium trenchii TaxID=1381693 RepID=A0ABP0RWM3_9DINO